MITDVAISPDGGTIAFTGVDINSSRPNTGGLYAIGSDGTGLRVLASADNAAHPEYSDDGLHLTGEGRRVLSDLLASFAGEAPDCDLVDAAGTCLG